jgi:lysyl-tRNA synthetase class 2
LSNEAEQIAQRKAKLEALVRLGVPPYPKRFDRTASISSAVAEHGGKTGEALEAERPEVRVAGRILGLRGFGKASFLALSDGEHRLQAYIRKDALPELDYKIFEHLDLGDHVGVAGRLFRTKTNELTVWVSSLRLLAKCLVPLPEKWHGLTDVEIRYRQRYLDLIVNPDSRRRRAGAPVHHASQHARPRSLHARRPGALPEAPDRRRHRTGVRDQP